MKESNSIKSTASLFEALQQLNNLSGGAMTLFVVDCDGKALGTLTDGDIRRAILKGVSLDRPVVDAARRDFRYVDAADIDVAALRNFREAGITLIPILDKNRQIVDIIDLSSQCTLLPLKAVLMAGGKGERMRPATITTPKPLLQIEGKAIIDYNIEALMACGINDITVTTHYLAEQIDAHFSKPIAGVSVKTVHEDAPMGTIGAVALTDVAQCPGDTLVMNSDLLTTISFEEMYLSHKQRNADVTIAVVPYQVSVPYAILSIDGSDSESVTGIEEKPAYSYYANAGIYIFSNKLLSTLSKDERCDATDLINRAIGEGLKVTYYTIKGTWIDVGSPVDFRQAGELMRHHNSMTGAKN
ncbi:MAG: NTP transferase domain-containing protein [Muribaculaceae bacterium]|nr:NTP transferase domain-containing protein [Muribaculaceae bacterium]